jgi:hypothetical protein
MIYIESHGSKSDALSFEVLQHPEHDKFCVQYYNEERKGSWFGWCDEIETPRKHIDKQLTLFKEIYGDMKANEQCSNVKTQVHNA